MSGDTNAWSESAQNDVLYPDDLAERGPVKVVSEPIEAEDVDVDGADHGTLAELAGDSPPHYLVCPQQLREELGERWDEETETSTIEVVEATRGPHDHDPWEFEFRVPGE